MAFRDTLKAAQARREFLAGKRPAGRMDIDWRDAPGAMPWPVGKGLDLGYSSIRPAPEAVSTSEYVAPEPRQPVTKRSGLSEGTKRGLSAAMMGASAGIQADVGPARRGSELSQGILKGIVGASTVASARARAEEEAAGRKQTLTDKLDLLKAGQKTSAQIEEEAAAGARGRLPYDLQKIKASSESQVERARKLGALGQASGKSESELRDLRFKTRTQAFNELDRTGINLKRPENADLVDILADKLYEDALETAPRPAGPAGILKMKR